MSHANYPAKKRSQESPVTKEKVQHSDFYNTLVRMNERIKVYKSVFLDKVTKQEERFQQKQMEKKARIKRQNEIN